MMKKVLKKIRYMSLTISRSNNFSLIPENYTQCIRKKKNTICLHPCIFSIKETHFLPKSIAEI